MGRKILVVDDEAVLVDTMAYNLEQAGYQVITAADGSGALEAARRESPDLIILDIMLPEMDGVEVCRQLRRENNTVTTPIMMLTAKGDEIDKVVGLEVGADDYVTKPFGRRELLARVRALLRRADYPSTSEERVVQDTIVDVPRSNRELVAGPLRIDLAGRRVNCRGNELDLQPKQFDLLVYLVRNRGTSVVEGLRHSALVIVHQAFILLPYRLLQKWASTSISKDQNTWTSFVTKHSIIL